MKSAEEQKEEIIGDLIYRGMHEKDAKITVDYFEEVIMKRVAESIQGVNKAFDRIAKQ